MEDFVIGIELVVQDNAGKEIANIGSWALSDATMQMIIEDVAEYLREEE